MDVPAVVTEAVPAPSLKARLMARPLPLLDSVMVLPLASATGVALAAKVPAPLLLVMLPPPLIVTTFATLAPPTMSSVLLPTAMVPVPAVPALFRRSVPARMPVPPLKLAAAVNSAIPLPETCSPPVPVMLPGTVSRPLRLKRSTPGLVTVMLPVPKVPVLPPPTPLPTCSTPPDTSVLP